MKEITLKGILNSVHISKYNTIAYYLRDYNVVACLLTSGRYLTKEQFEKEAEGVYLGAEFINDRLELYDELKKYFDFMHSSKNTEFINGITINKR